jgi:hypothetical protein
MADFLPGEAPGPVPGPAEAALKAVGLGAWVQRAQARDGHEARIGAGKTWILEK